MNFCCTRVRLKNNNPGKWTDDHPFFATTFRFVFVHSRSAWIPREITSKISLGISFEITLKIPFRNPPEIPSEITPVIFPGIPSVVSPEIHSRIPVGVPFVIPPGAPSELFLGLLSVVPSGILAGVSSEIPKQGSIWDSSRNTFQNSLSEIPFGTSRNSFRDFRQDCFQIIPNCLFWNDVGIGFAWDFQK